MRSSRLLLLTVLLQLSGSACSASSGDEKSPSSPGGAAGAASGGSAGASAGTSSAGSSSGGPAGSAGATSGAGGAGAGTAGSGGGGATAGGVGGGVTGGSAGSGGGSDCTPNPSGTFMVSGDVVFDPKTCLTWMRTNTSGDPYAAAEAYCAALSLGGHDDWRLPSAGEVPTIFKCDGTYPPVVDVFEVMGDGIWTTTLSGTIAGDEPKVCGAGQASGQFYDFGKVGGQNTRCVRGPATLPDRTDCKTNNSICAN